MLTKRKLSLATTAALSVALLGGCAATQTKPNANELASYQSQLQQAQTENSQLKEQLAKQTAAPASAETNSGNALYPPNAKPGECYARVMTPAQYSTTSKQIEVSPASDTLHVVPAQYKWVEKQMLAKAASTKLVVVPATFKTVSEQVMVSPESKKISTVPAQYTTQTETVVDVPEHTVWHRGTSLVPGAIQTKVDRETGDIMCLIKVPATYKTITKKVLVSPATSQQQDIPAQYKTVTHRVVDTPATTRTIDIPAVYKTVRVRELVSPAATTKTPIAARYKTVTSQELVKPESLSWRRVVCETNMTPELARELQGKLQGQHYYKGKIDGLYGPLTMSAVSGYAKANDLPASTHFITYGVLKSLGVNQP